MRFCAVTSVLVLMLALLLPGRVAAQVHFVGPAPSAEERAWAADAAVRVDMVTAWHQDAPGKGSEYRLPKRLSVCPVRSPDQLVRVRRWNMGWEVRDWKPRMAWKDVIYEWHWYGPWRLSAPIYTLTPSRPTGYGGLWDGRTAFVCAFLGADTEWELMIHEFLHAARTKDGAEMASLEWQAEQTPLHLTYTGPDWPR